MVTIIMKTPIARLTALWPLLLLLLLVAVNGGAYLLADRAPTITGVLLPQAQSLQAFSLQDHRRGIFNNRNLLGRWHLLAYGYTDCPDVCPTLLSVLAKFERRIFDARQYEDLAILFYSIDPGRDEVEKMAGYLSFFSPNFIGLRRRDDQEDLHRPFEQSLGLMAQLTPLPDDELNKNRAAAAIKNYEVGHGFMLYLLNPEGQLQAVLKPQAVAGGIPVFSADRLYRDYRAVRAYSG